jgi:hypothetical protein
MIDDHNLRHFARKNTTLSILKAHIFHGHKVTYSSFFAAGVFSIEIPSSFKFRSK